MKSNSKTPAKKKESTTNLIKSTNTFPVVGIGASAGGLDAFKKLLKAIPANSGLAYVLVQHLDPKHESLLPEILQKVTNIPVMEITDDVKVQPNHIYVIPSNKMMVANDGVLQLTTRTHNKNERNLPIDLFFSSLAEIHQSHSIGVVLSGTASDGTQGLKAIKDCGGFTFAQNVESAAYDGMPQSAINAGVVDFILPPDQIPQKLLEITKITNGHGNEEENIPLKDADVYKQILSLIRIRKGTDFTYYKQTTLLRRILRRMALNKNEEPAAYLKFLKENKAEQDILFQDFLIPVTSFFRDPRSFDNLCETVFPVVANTKASGEPLRVWVAGCSTGKEAYTIAICLKEFFQSTGISDTEGRVQIFATDLNETAIVKARSGIYTATEIDGLSPVRLQNFFTKTNGSYQANKSIRDMCVFAVHNFVKDPPFGKIDILSCRNVLIYMEPYLQKRALTTFHYALNPKGFLLLGKSETIAGVPDLFSNAAKDDKLFSRKDTRSKYMHVATQHTEKNFTEVNAAPKPENTRTDFQKTADDIMLSKYTPAGVVVNEAMDIVHFRGKTANYLEQLPGKPSHNLLKMAKDGLAFELRNILHQAKKSNTSVTKDGIPVEINGKLCNITLEAMLLPGTIEPHYLILFHENSSDSMQSAASSRQSAGGKKKTAVKNDDKDLRIAQLEKELAQSREDMRSITEDQETANEELQSINEELLSGSEELQSLNEEMETSKEELQSTNEELMVVNQEMISLNEEVNVALHYSEAIVATIREPLLVLDKDLRIKSANINFYKTFLVNELETVGKRVYDLGNGQWNIPELRILLEKILPEKSRFKDFEVRATFTNLGERVMLVNGCEIINKNTSEKLILLAISDVTEQKNLEQKEKELNEIFHNMVIQAPVSMIVFKGPTHIVEIANEPALEMMDKTWEEVKNKSIFDTLPEAEAQGFRQIFENIYKTGKSVSAEEREVKVVRQGKTETLYVNFVYDAFRDLNGKITGVVGVGNDVTEQVLARKKIEESEMQQAFLLNLSDALRPLSNPVEIEEAATKIALDFMGSDRCYYSAIDGDNVIILQDASREGLPSIAGVHSISGFALYKAVLNAGRPFVVDDVSTSGILDEDLKKVCLQYQYGSFINVPIIKSGKPAGLFSVVQTKPRKWADIEVQLSVETAERTWAAVERAKAEEALRESEYRFRLALAGSTQVVFSQDKNLKHTWIYNAHSDFKPEDIVGKSDNELHVPATGKILTDIKKNILKTGKAYHGEVEIELDGKIVNYAMHIEAIRDAEKNITGIIGTVMDITERIKAQQRIKESEEQFSTLANNINNLAWMANEDGWIFWYNNRWYEYTGTTPAEMEGWGWKSVHDPEQLPLVMERWQQSINTGQPFEMTFPLRGADNKFRSFLTRVEPMRNIEGKVIRWVGTNTDISEQIETGKTLSLLSTIVESSADAIISKTLDSIITSWNKGAERIFGYTAEEVIGKPITMLIPPELHQEEEMVISNVKNGKSVLHFETIRLTKSGNKINIALTVSPVKDKEGKIIGASKIARDITERKNIQAQLEYRKALLEAHNDASVDGLLLVDAKGKIISYNQRFIEIWNMPKQIVDQKNDEAALAFAMTQLEHPQQFIEKIKYLYAHPNEISKDELEFKDGKIIERHGYPVVAPDGSYYAWSWTFRDITETRKAENAIRASEQHFRQLADLMPEKVTHTDALGNVVYFNQNWLDYTGLNSDELIAGWEKVIHPDDAKITIPKWAHAIELGIPLETEERIRNNEGEYRWHLSRVVPVKDENGKINKWISATTEIQEQKEQREVLKKAVAERTKQLQQANSSLEAKNVELGNMIKEVNSFTYVASHDLQEPLRKIQTFAGRVLARENDNLSETGKDYFHRMQDAAARMQQLIEDLLSFSRLNTSERKFETVDLNLIVNEVKSDLSEAITEKHATIESNDFCELSVIPFQLRQMLQNLITNSLKFSNDNVPPKIILHCEVLAGEKLNNPNLEPQKKYCHLSVTDNGIGFEPELKNKIFEVFQKLHGKSEYAGTGIGLAIVKKIVENHNGIITATSELNKGARFDIYLPVID